MSFRILNNRLLYITRPGLSLYKPCEYAEQIIIPISKVSSVSLTRNYLEIRLENSEKFGFNPDSIMDAQAAFKDLLAALDEKSPVLIQKLQ